MRGVKGNPFIKHHALITVHDLRFEVLNNKDTNVIRVLLAERHTCSVHGLKTFVHLQ